MASLVEVALEESGASLGKMVCQELSALQECKVQQGLKGQRVIQARMANLGFLGRMECAVRRASKANLVALAHKGQRVMLECLEGTVCLVLLVQWGQQASLALMGFLVSQD
jgi:hypothetical protein